MNELQAAVYVLVKHFVERQYIVKAVMDEQRPENYLLSNPTLLSVEELYELDELAEKRSQSPGSGYWGVDKEWRFAFHGMGCRLIHTKTGETLDWDAGDVERFDCFFFLNYVTWAIDNTLDESVITIKKYYVNVNQNAKSPLENLILPVLEELCQLGYLLKSNQQHTQNKYLLSS